METASLEVITGTVEEVVFHSDDSGFTVLELSDGVQLITVVGELLSVDPGEELRVTGRYGNHPTYGVQFKAQLIERMVPATANAILKYLSSGAIRGVGPGLARRLVDQFGDETLSVMEREPARLQEVRGISAKKAQEIGEEYQRIFGIRSVMLFLSRFSIEPALAIRVWKEWGMEAPNMIADDPYCLCGEAIGLEFERADQIAGKLELSADDPARLAGGILHVLRHNQRGGHCCLPLEKLLRTAAKLLLVEKEQLEEMVRQMEERQDLVVETVEGVPYVYLPQMYQAETYVAGRLQMLLSLQCPEEVDVTKDIDAMEGELGIRYAALQRRAIAAAVSDKLLILTGGPGTGKTTTLNGIITLLEKRGHRVGLAAPTGRAAKRMSELTGREAKTIHRLLEVDFGQEKGRTRFRRGPKNPLSCDVVVIDEMSMVDVELFENLLRACRTSGKLILVGDPDQLPSVGAGNVLRDLIDCGLFTTVHLTEVFRQAAESLIVTNAHAIVAGELPELRKRSSDFFFLPQHSAAEAMDTVIGLCGTRLPKAYGYSPLTDIQVIAPSRMGPLGTGELNRQLQELLNPPAPDKVEWKQTGVLFRERDKVMQVRNDYDIVWTKDSGEQGVGVFNGDIGVIEMIDKPSRTILVRYDDRVAEYVFEMAGELELAYAITVHKSQGSEFEAVVLPVMGSHARLYYRNLLYTAVTRAKKLLVVVGQASSIQQMVRNDRRTLRYTNLRPFLTEALGAVPATPEETEVCT